VPLIRDTPAGELSPYLEQHRTNPAWCKGGAFPAHARVHVRRVCL